MTKAEIQAALSEVPEHLKDAGPEEMISFIEITFPDLEENEVNTLTAFYLIQKLPESGTLKNSMKALSLIKQRLKTKYSELAGSPDHPLWPFIEVAAIAVTRNKLAIVFN